MADSEDATYFSDWESMPALAASASAAETASDDGILIEPDSHLEVISQTPCQFSGMAAINSSHFL